MKVTRFLLTLSSLLLTVYGSDAAAQEKEVYSGEDEQGRTTISSEPWSPPEDSTFGAKVIYGSDDRRDIYQENDADRLQLSRSVCGLLNSSQLTDNGNGTYSIALSEYQISGTSACPDEPYGDQPTAMFCTGFLVGEDLIATAGHCYSSTSVAGVRFVFGFEMTDSTTPQSVVSADRVYQGVSVVGRQLINDLDYAIVRVDRRVTSPGAVPLPLRRAGVVPMEEKVGVIGHPAGLPMKIAFGAETEVYGNSAGGYFTANLDTYGGNSGSPVFNQQTGVVEGILVRGATDYQVTTCFRSNQLSDDEAAEEVSKSLTFEKLVPGIGFDQTAYTAGQVASLHVVDDNLLPSTLSVSLTSTAGDSEVVLASDPENDNVYTVAVTLAGSAAAVVPGNGTLETLCSGSISASYSDADAGASTARTFTDTVSLDCTPPSGNVTVTNVQSDSATVLVEADEPVTGTVELMLDCTTVLQSIPFSSPGKSFRIQIENLLECQSYGVRVQIADAVGNVALLDNGGICFPLKTSARALHFEDTFEPAPAADWSSAALSGEDNFWAHVSSGYAKSPSTVFANAPASAAVADAVLITPPLPSGDLFEFYHTFQLEWNSGTGVAYDGAVLEISSDGGTNWVDAGDRIIENGYNGVVSTSYSNPLGGRSAWTGGTLGTMQRVRVDLTGYTGSLLFRFRVGSDTSYQSAGWYIDDVRIVSQLACHGDAAPAVKIAGPTGNTLEPGAVAEPLAGTIFPELLPGLSAQHRFYVHNEGTAYLDISTISLSGDQASSFAVVPPADLVLAPGESLEFSVSFAPMAAGLHSAVLSVYSNDPSTPLHSFDVIGSASDEVSERPDLTVSPLSRQKVKKRKATGEFKVTEVVAISNSGTVAVDQALVTVFRSSKPYLDDTAEMVLSRSLKRLKPDKAKKVKLKTLTAEATGYLFIRVEPVQSASEDAAWANNQVFTVYPSL